MSAEGREVTAWLRLVEDTGEYEGESVLNITTVSNLGRKQT